MLLLILICLLLYALLLLAFYQAWNKMQASPRKLPPEGELISIIIPFRNEAPHLAKLWNSLKAQDYGGAVEWIFVDDHSEDNGSEILQSMARNENDIVIRIEKLHNNAQGKKSALQKGVDLAAGELLLFTDADVRHPPTWVAGMRQAIIQHKQRHFCWGGIRLVGEKTSILALQQLEYGILMLSGAAAPSLGFPLMSTGANLIIRKKSLKSLGPDPWYKKMASGDDVFLMHRIWEKFGKDSIGFVKSNKVLCESPGMPRWDALFAQRLRWAGKSGKAGIISFITGGVVISANLAFFVLLLLFCFGQADFTVAGTGLLLKTIPEWMLASAWTKWAGQRSSLRAFPWLMIGYPIWMIMLLTAALWGQTSWKGRKVKVR